MEPTNQPVKNPVSQNTSTSNPITSKSIVPSLRIIIGVILIICFIIWLFFGNCIVKNFSPNNPNGWGAPIYPKGPKDVFNCSFYEFPIVKIYYRLFPKRLGPDIVPNLNDYCVTDSDCECGTNINTGACFYGNKKYVNTSKQCPDFCTGFGNNLTIKCIDNKCTRTDKPTVPHVPQANSNLQTFSSSTFSFQYPNDMTPKTDSFSQDVKEYVSVGAMGPTQKAYAKDTECFDCWSFSVSRWDLSPKDIMTRLKEEQSFSKEECGESAATDIKEVTVDGNVGYQFESTCRGNWVYTLVYKNGFDYELIQFYGNVADYMPQVKSTIQQIFSSFKFK